MDNELGPFFRETLRSSGSPELDDDTDTAMSREKEGVYYVHMQVFSVCMSHDFLLI